MPSPQPPTPPSFEMSPFASSLLALAALLATAHGYCTTKHVGDYSNIPVDYEPIEFMPPGVEVHVDNSNCQYPMRVVGEDITACNNDPYGAAPHIDGPEDGIWSPFNVLCSGNECPNGGTANIRQYCNY